ncbi:hypothetical protein [Aurantimonas coralicida]|uniref:hypothetical protein n=1 Tax=Aurantimonas coralicida TaxID=182270 RepID=UPI001E50E300|nr:hypothetical protein [Aurantimonas coralicida]MCD1643094.1 hypothetical protein [Aurantimonas coralicida]|tara:strand:- start:67 stop:780 length:714 start_codon:yes stop_codon:yes gene_type:complete
MSDLTWLTPSTATILAAIVAGAAGYATAGWRVREIRLAYEQKIRDNYLENARQVGADLYVPLAIAIAKLNERYYQLRVHANFETIWAPPGAINRFKGAVSSFNAELENLISRGATAYLTLDLESELSSFQSFLRESVNAEDVTRKYTLEASLSGFINPIRYRGKIKDTGILVGISRASAAAVPLSMGLGPINLENRQEIISAPLASKEFEQRYKEGSLLISSLIKEVTLGSRGSVAG